MVVVPVVNGDGLPVLTDISVIAEKYHLYKNYNQLPFLRVCVFQANWITTKWQRFWTMNNATCHGNLILRDYISQVVQIHVCKTCCSDPSLHKDFLVVRNTFLIHFLNILIELNLLFKENLPINSKILSLTECFTHM